MTRSKSSGTRQTGRQLVGLPLDRGLDRRFGILGRLAGGALRLYRLLPIWRVYWACVGGKEDKRGKQRAKKPLRLLRAAFVISNAAPCVSAVHSSLRFDWLKRTHAVWRFCVNTSAGIDVSPCIALVINNACTSTACARASSAVILTSQRNAVAFLFRISSDFSGLSAFCACFCGFRWCISTARTSSSKAGGGGKSDRA